MLEDEFNPDLLIFIASDLSFSQKNWATFSIYRCKLGRKLFKNYELNRNSYFFLLSFLFSFSLYLQVRKKDCKVKKKKNTHKKTCLHYFLMFSITKILFFISIYIIMCYISISKKKNQVQKTNKNPINNIPHDFAFSFDFNPSCKKIKNKKKTNICFFF